MTRLLRGLAKSLHRLPSRLHQALHRRVQVREFIQPQTQRIFARDRVALEVAASLQPVHHAEQLAAVSPQPHPKLRQRERGRRAGQCLKNVEPFVECGNGVVRLGRIFSTGHTLDYW